MKNRMIFRILPFALLLILIGGVTVFAASAATDPAFDAIAEGVTLVKGQMRGKTVGFEVDDFRRALGVRTVKSVRVETLPDASDGILRVGTSRVNAGQTIPKNMLSLLRFTPASDDVEEASFTFSLPSVGVGQAIACHIRFTDGANYAPTVTSDGGAVSASTHKDVACYGEFSATDPEGDDVEFIVVRYPKRGTLNVSGSAYSYIPGKGYTGSDDFLYVARDRYGNYSQTSKVSIRVNASPLGTCFADMTDSPAYNAAITATDAGIMQGERMGDDIWFLPSGTLTRAEFTVMVMRAAGERPAGATASTYFDDNADIPTALRPYIAAAQRAGYIVGNFNGEGLYFEPNRTITRAEAGKIVRAVCNLGEAVSVLPTQSPAASDPITRADAAETVAAILNRR